MNPERNHFCPYIFRHNHDLRMSHTILEPGRGWIITLGSPVVYCWPNAPYSPPSLLFSSLLCLSLCRMVRFQKRIERMSARIGPESNIPKYASTNKLSLRNCTQEPHQKLNQGGKMAVFILRSITGKREANTTSENPLKSSHSVASGRKPQRSTSKSTDFGRSSELRKSLRTWLCEFCRQAGQK